MHEVYEAQALALQSAAQGACARIQPLSHRFQAGVAVVVQHQFAPHKFGDLIHAKFAQLLAETCTEPMARIAS